MKYRIVLIIVLTHAFLNPLLCITKSKTTRDIIQVDTHLRDSLQKKIITDSINFQLKIDTIQKSYSLIIFHLRNQNEQLEYLVQKRATIIMLLILLSGVLTLIIFRVISRKIPFSSFPFYLQRKGEQPGLVCLQMMYRYFYKKRISYKKLVKESNVIQNPNSLSLEDIVLSAEKLGFEAKVVKTGLRELCNDIPLPVMLYMPNHMVVFVEYKKDNFFLSDPYYGHSRTKPFYFATTWFIDDKNMEGIAIVLFPVKKIKNSIRKKLDVVKFNKIRMWDKRNWKNYSCELVIEE